jgi:hypothetical protein
LRIGNPRHFQGKTNRLKLNRSDELGFRIKIHLNFKKYNFKRNNGNAIAWKCQIDLKGQSLT